MENNESISSRPRARFLPEKALLFETERCVIEKYFIARCEWDVGYDLVVVALIVAQQIFGRRLCVVGTVTNMFSSF